MSEVLCLPGYFPSISQYVAMLSASNLWFEMGDHFQKQTHRNRMYIYSPNGKQLLNVPVKHNQGIRQMTKDVRIENAFGWQKNHFKSLEAGYRSSPYFEYFEDDIQVLFQKKYDFLMDLNLAIFEIVNECLGVRLTFSPTTEFYKNVEDKIDARSLIDRKKDETEIEPYHQVFEDKHGFINNLSILDLLFNEGRHAVDYLKRQQISL
jgi:hypothetical protein